MSRAPDRQRGDEYDGRRVPPSAPEPLPQPDARTTLHVRGAIEGDADSLSWVVGHLSPLLLAHASYRLGPGLRRRYDPEDLVSEAWLVALPRLRQLPARNGRYTPVLLRFLSTTLVQRIYGLARSHLRERAATDPGPAPSVVADAETSGVVTAAIRRERADRVQATLETLEPMDRQLILLRGIEQLSFEAIAAQLDTTAVAAARRYQRALHKLRARLPGSVYDELEDGGADRPPS